MSNADAKKFYNETMPGKFGDDYEYSRWFKDEVQRTGYTQTKEAITAHVLSDGSLSPKRVLELGPGAGTWTKLLLVRFPNAHFDILDISKEMLARARGALGPSAQVQTIESDFLEWTPAGKYEYFFSSRVLEYIDDKKKFCEKVFSVLLPTGRGFLITKMPHYGRERYLGRQKSDFHRGQIAPAALCALLRSAGFIEVQAHPVTMVFPLLRFAFANRMLGKIFSGSTIGPIGSLFAESYAVEFHKP